MKRLIKYYIEFIIHKYRQYKCYRFYSSQFKNYIKIQGFQNEKVEGEDEYVSKWKVLSPRVEPFSYRFFSHYVGYSPNIIPEDIGHSYIEPILNPIPYRLVYSVKSLFPKIIGANYLPRSIVCRINNSCLLDENFQKAEKDLSVYIGNVNELVLKPSIGGSSGKGIVKFFKDGNVFLSDDKSKVLTKEFLSSYGSDFCLQEAVRQHEFMLRLCSTSVNTIRLCVYKSVKDEKARVLSGFLRIGREGSIVDNVHMGGMIIGVDVCTGELGHCLYDQFGNKTTKWNNVDYASTRFAVPNWQNIIQFAEMVGSRIYHHRLLGLDIALTESGNPILIEYNLNSFGFWAFMLTGQEVFGKYTDEIITYCRTSRSSM